MRADDYLTEICRLLIFFVLLMAAAGKTLSFKQFKHNLLTSFQVPEQLSSIAALIIIGIEGIFALLIALNGALTYWAMWGTLLLFILFTLIILLVLLQDKVIRCHCFGQTEQKITVFDLLCNMFLIFACGYFLLFQSEGQYIDNIARLLLAGVALILFQLVTKLYEIVNLLRFKIEGIASG